MVKTQENLKRFQLNYINIEEIEVLRSALKEKGLKKFYNKNTYGVKYCR